MNKMTRFVSVLFVIGLAVGIVCIADNLARLTGFYQIRQTEAEARQAEARARELEAQSALLRERQAMLQTGVLAFASAKDSVLVTVTYLVGGVALFLAVVVIGVLLLERGKDHHERVL